MTRELDPTIYICESEVCAISWCIRLRCFDLTNISQATAFVDQSSSPAIGFHAEIINSPVATTYQIISAQCPVW